jgi:uncharacterized repeat protein (TIGR03847 family)
MNERMLNPQIFTADYVGEPGERTFFVQVRGDEGKFSYLVEKQQVAVLAEKLRELLMAIDQNDTVRSTPPARDPALALEEPVEPEWRVGTIGLAYEEDSDQVLVFVQPVDDAEDDADAEDDEEFSVSFNLRRDQVRSFVLHTIAVVAEGRPVCQLCGLPMDPAGHDCPASNGHRLFE